HKVKISLFAQQRISLIFLFCCKKGLGITQKEAFVLTNAMLVLSDKHKESLDEFHRGFNHPYKK
ncbi:MAG: hypothetical protein IJ408_03580, partial [Clostridia bacterium]|nr:hypothetical protein [Clostridia bacterium]